MSTVVFVGPSDPTGGVRAHLEGAFIAPPAHRGDVLRAVQEGFSTILLIDGYFDTTPAVWHKELLYALSEGLRVYGASSMGALRAAEMWPFGMVGIGEVFEAVNDGLLDDDDVVVIHDHESEGATSRSVAMVNIRWSLRSAAENGVIDHALANRFDELAKSMFYPERTYTALLANARKIDLIDKETSDRLHQWLRNHAIDIKAQDAITAALRVASDLDAGRESPPPPPFVRTRYFDTFVSEEADRTERRVDNWTRSVIDELRTSPERYRSVKNAALQRRASIAVARSAGVRQDVNSLDRAWDELRREQRLHEPAQVDDWLRRAGLTGGDYGPFIEREAMARWGSDHIADPDPIDLLDILRTEGTYKELAQRATARGDHLRATGRTETGDAMGEKANAAELRERFARHTGLELDQCSDEGLCELLDFPGVRALHEFLAVFAATQSAVTKAE